jgi:hypothetical protein
MVMGPSRLPCLLYGSVAIPAEGDEAPGEDAWFRHTSSFRLKWGRPQRSLAEAPNVDDLGRLVVAQIQGVSGITRTLTCPVVHI